MLNSLLIENVVLIEKLALHFPRGLTALTGETGAGKSIILDSLALVLGARADSGMIRTGADSARVTAEFELPALHSLWRELDAEKDAPLIISRSISREGKSRATLNDRPVTIETLRKIGDALVDIHSQFETHALLETSKHRMILDIALPDQKYVSATANSWEGWQDAKARVAELKNSLERAQWQQAQWEADKELLDKLQPKIGEEDILLEQRGRAQKSGKMAESYTEAIAVMNGNEDAADKGLNRAWKVLSRLPEDAALNEVQTQIDQAISLVRDASDRLQEMGYALRDVPNIEAVDDRLHALRDAARRFNVSCDALAALHTEIAEKLSLLSSDTKELAKAEALEIEKRDAFIQEAQKLSEARKKQAVILAKKVNAELPPLKLERAQFSIEIEAVDEAAWSANGTDKIRFLAAMNTGQEPSPLHKTASGGELSRLLLAIKMVLSGGQPVLIFDEIDQGVGGATAAAIGARLKRLGDDHQVIVVTHSAQVAASANAHFVVQKAVQNKTTYVVVTELATIESRRDEVARMLSGAAVTNEAKAAAEKLLEGNV